MAEDSDDSESILPLRAVGSQHNTPDSSNRTSPASSVQDLHVEVLESRDSPIITDGPSQASESVLPALEIRPEESSLAAGSDECPVTDQGSDPAEPLASAEQPQQPHPLTSTGASPLTHWSGSVQASEFNPLVTLASSPEVQAPVHTKPAESPREATEACRHATPAVPNLPPSSHDNSSGADKTLPAVGAKAATAPDADSTTRSLLLGRTNSVKAEDSHARQSAVTPAAGTSSATVVKKPLPASRTLGSYHGAVGPAKGHSSLREKSCVREDSTLRMHPFLSLDSLLSSNRGLRLSTQAAESAATEETPTGEDIRSQQDLIRQHVRGDGVRAARRCKSALD